MQEGQELIINPGPLLAKPVVIIPATMLAIMEGDMAQADAMLDIQTEEDFKACANLVNHMGRTYNSEKTRITGLGAPARNLAKDITARGDEKLDPYFGKMTAVAKSMGKWKTDRDKERAQAIADQTRRNNEAAENLRLANLEKKRLEDEAEVRRKDATKDLKAATTEPQFQAAAEKFDKALLVSGQAAAVATGQQTEALALAAAPIAAPEAMTLAKPAGAVTFIPVVSSMLNAGGFENGTVNSEVGTAHIQFKNGDVWKYFDVPVAVFNDFLKADSPGKFFAAFIKPNRRAEKVLGEAQPVPQTNLLSIPLPIPAAAPKAKGVKGKKEVDILSHDLALLPITYHMLDAVKVRKHVLDGTITAATPGIAFNITETFTGTGR